MRTVVTASAIGTTIEWYDFLIYSTAASLVLNKLFFPTSDLLVGKLLAIGTIGTASFFALGRLNEAQFMSWGWRLHGATWPVSTLMIGLALVTMAAVLYAKETAPAATAETSTAAPGADFG